MLDEIEAAHAAVGGSGPGGRFAAQQVNHAYVVMLCSQFQKCCRDLHTECVDALTAQTAAVDRRLPILRRSLLSGRKLDSGNPNPGNIGSDFGRLEIEVWGELKALDPRNDRLLHAVEELCTIRNAIAHQDFTAHRLRGRRTIRLADVRRWRRACDKLVTAFDRLLADHLTAIIGRRPW